MCVLSYVTSADSRVVAVAILATLLSLMGAGFLVFLKRKTLVHLLFTNKKTTMEKLRYSRTPPPTPVFHLMFWISRQNTFIEMLSCRDGYLVEMTEILFLICVMVSLW